MVKRLALLLLPLSAGADPYLDPKGIGFDPFVPFAALGASERTPPDAGLSVAPEGHLLWNGKPKYFTATIWYGATELECQEDTPGYVDSLKRLPAAYSLLTRPMDGDLVQCGHELR